MPLFIVDCISSHRMRYVIEAKTLEHAYDEVTMRDSGTTSTHFEEVSQRWLGETIIDGREVSSEELQKVVDSMRQDKNELCSHWMVDKLIRKVQYEDSGSK